MCEPPLWYWLFFWSEHVLRVTLFTKSVYSPEVLFCTRLVDLLEVHKVDLKSLQGSSAQALSIGPPKCFALVDPQKCLTQLLLRVLLACPLSPACITNTVAFISAHFCTTVGLTALISGPGQY